MPNPIPNVHTALSQSIHAHLLQSIVVAEVVNLQWGGQAESTEDS